MIRLKQLRRENNLSVKELSDIIGINVRNINAYERGDIKPKYTTIKKLADYFGVSVDYFTYKNIPKKTEIKHIAHNADVYLDVVSLLKKLSEENLLKMKQIAETLIFKQNNN